MTRQEVRRETTRSAIVAAAIDLFGHQGYDGSSIDAVAAAAGVAKGAVYHHFPNKRALFASAFDAVSADVAARVADISSDHRDGLGALQTGARVYFEACASAPTQRILLQDGPAVLGLAEWRSIDARHFGGQVRAALGFAMKQAVIRAQPLDAATTLVLGALQAAAIDCAAQDSFKDAAREHLAVFASLLNGLR